jgi:hypothetical protein
MDPKEEEAKEKAEALEGQEDTVEGGEEKKKKKKKKKSKPNQDNTQE